VSSQNRRFFIVHKWSSLICTAFLLVICLSGLPLIFMDEINDAVMPSREAAALVPGDTRTVSTDRFLAESHARFPGQLVSSVFFDDDEPVAFVELVPSFAAVKANPDLSHWLKFDVRTGELINTSEQYERDSSHGAAWVVGNLLKVMLRLHIDLFAKLPGQLFLGFMALMFVTAIVSGVVLYAPFMKKLPFGSVRTERSTRVKWLDMHNLLGVVTLAWVLVVGLTGAINEIAGPLFQLWIGTDVRAAWASYQGHTPPRQDELASAQAALDTAKHALPGMNATTLMFPRPDIGSAYHYGIWMRGNTPLTKQLSTVVLVDAKTGQLTKVLPMPWYLRLLELSRPLHFGNYGGLPLKILWSVLDLITIVVLGSGLYLWLARRKQGRERQAKLDKASAGVRARPIRDEVNP
jgi:uncharacterized iron-regulated membrane protein